jgi:hypothetical protein
MHQNGAEDDRARPPRLRIVRGTEWSTQRAQRKGNTPTT